MPEEKDKIVWLFKNIQAGNERAFDELFLRYYDRLISFAFQYLRHSESAEEVVSEFFVRLWVKREILSNVLNPEVYLFVAIKNACLNLIRSERKAERLWSKNLDGMPFENVPDPGGELMEEKELAQLIDFAVAALPAQRRIIFRLIKEDGLKSSAVAAILGISTRTVENQLYKAVKTIAGSISSYLGYHPQKKITRKRALSNVPLLFF
ncbi:MAG: RNA polymerase sigma-70 factor [Bacteroidota bacterium]